jgi:hypothetical protein
MSRLSNPSFHLATPLLLSTQSKQLKRAFSISRLVFKIKPAFLSMKYAIECALALENMIDKTAKEQCHCISI